MYSLVWLNTSTSLAIVGRSKTSFKSDGDKVVFFRSDVGGEYIDTDVQDWLKEKGIKWEPTAPYTPDQNSKAERHKYTLMSAIRAILAYTRLPKSL